MHFSCWERDCENPEKQAVKYTAFFFGKSFILISKRFVYSRIKITDSKKVLIKCQIGR